MPFTRTLDQWKDVDPNNRTKFDAYISSSLSRVGNRRKIRVVEEAKPIIFHLRDMIIPVVFQNHINSK
jgi:hypothetical protein